jgi:hypothetical protein
MGSHPDTTASPDYEREQSMVQLTQIKGISDKTAGALYDLGIHHCAGLAQYLAERGVEALSQALLEQGVHRAAGTIKEQDWIGQARDLSTPAGSAHAPSESGAASVHDAVHDAGRAAAGATWKQQAEFTLFFDFRVDDDGAPVLDARGERVWQARLYNGESGDQERLPIEPPTWLDWILQRAGLPITRYPVDAGTVEEEGPAEAAAEFIVKAGDIEIRDGTVSGILERTLLAEIPVSLTGPHADRLATSESVFEIQAFLADLERGSAERVEIDPHHVRLEPGKTEYNLRTEFSMPPPGRYELQTRVWLTLLAEERASEPFRVELYSRDRGA